MHSCLKECKKVDRLEWVFREDPKLVKKIYSTFTKEELQRIKKIKNVKEKIKNNILKYNLLMGEKK